MFLLKLFAMFTITKIRIYSKETHAVTQDIVGTHAVG